MKVKHQYCPPETDVLEVKFEGVMCQSQPVENEFGGFVGENRDGWEE